MITNEELRGLDGPTYAYALWNGLFAVHELVLRDRQEEYGRYAYVLRSWWTAYRVTYGEYLPCLTVLTFRSVGRYVCACGEAIAAMWSRCYEFGEGGFWIAVILVSLSLFLPMALYDALEYVSCGPVGLFLLLLLFNALNLAFSWTDSYVIISLTIVGIGLFSHGWHLCAESTVMRRVTPVALVTNALDSVQRNAALRVRTEHANAERLRAPDSDPLEDYPTDDGGTSENETLEEGERPHSEASPPDILEDFTAVEVFVADVLRGLRTLSQRPVRRGRRTPGRGDFPVPGNTSGVLDGRPLGSVPDPAEVHASTAPTRAYRA
ncbi:hypothetical protein F441_22354 [Phytophthora nicotianae CJ01A1]|nr:hypothetical protein F441_22354 [Phytophthora nicotianae CJ01A1]